MYIFNICDIYIYTYIKYIHMLYTYAYIYIERLGERRSRRENKSEQPKSGKWDTRWGFAAWKRLPQRTARLLACLSCGSMRDYCDRKVSRHVLACLVAWWHVWTVRASLIGRAGTWTCKALSTHIEALPFLMACTYNMRRLFLEGHGLSSVIIALYSGGFV